MGVREFLGRNSLRFRRNVCSLICYLTLWRKIREKHKKEENMPLDIDSVLAQIDKE